MCPHCMKVPACVQEEGMGLCLTRRGKQDGGTLGKGHGPGQHLAPTVVCVSEEEVEISNSFSKCFLQKNSSFSVMQYIAASTGGLPLALGSLE